MIKPVQFDKIKNIATFLFKLFLSQGLIKRYKSVGITSPGPEGSAE